VAEFINAKIPSHTKMSKAYDQYRELLSQRQFGEAARFAEQAHLEGNPANPFWLTRQAVALTRAGEYGHALTVSEQALALAPANPYAVLCMAEALSGLRRYKEALEYYEPIATDANDKVATTARKGMLECLAELRSWERILEQIGIWEMPPDRVYRWRVKAVEGQNRTDDAIDICHQWLKDNPDHPQALWALTELEIRRDGFDAVLTRMGRLARIPSRPTVYKEIYASLCKRAGKPELALKQYEKMVHTASDPNIHRKKAFALAKSGREPEAIPLMEELLKLNPKDFYIHSAYIPACRRVKQLDRAMEFYQSLLVSHPAEKSIYGRLKKLKNTMES
jgi:tetratricopeptide (TPR) repeat protein